MCFFFKQKTAYEMRISDWSSDVCSSDLKHTIPTAVFYNADERSTVFGRQAIAEYQGGFDGRLLRSLKSLLGSELISETTLVNGKPLAYREIIAGFLQHLRHTAQAHTESSIDRVVLGRPVFFVDDNAERDQLEIGRAHV